MNICFADVSFTPFIILKYLSATTFIVFCSQCSGTSMPRCSKTTFPFGPIILASVVFHLTESNGCCPSFENFLFHLPAAMLGLDIVSARTESILPPK